ncbi:MAG: hypothetical protein K2X29_15170, partial [Candidatus Obscuribacterales bacterium]|nr:hypothetical protein [Candidatus Obscuribacterales bacterium]
MFAKLLMGFSAASLLASWLPVEADTNPATEAANWTPILMKSVEPPRPFTGIDGLRNLVYEVVLTNYGRKPVKIVSFEAMDKDSVLLSLSKRKLADNLTEVGKTESADTMLQPGEVGIAWMNITLADGKNMPESLSHRLTYKEVPGTEDLVESGAVTAVDLKEPIHIGPPLQGSNWIANNCYDG